MGSSNFVYVTYIKTTADKLWMALTTPQFMEQYWLGARAEADWKVGGAWKLVFSDGRIADSGQITEFEPHKRLAIRWRNEWSPEMHDEGWTNCVMEIEAAESDTVKLTISHSMERENSKFIGAVGQGWPMILSNLKSLLETGAVIMPRKY